MALDGYRKAILARNKLCMLNFCNFLAPVKSMPRTIYLGKSRFPRHDFWSNALGLPGGGGGGGEGWRRMVMLGTETLLTDCAVNAGKYSDCSSDGVRTGVRSVRRTNVRIFFSVDKTVS